MIDRVGEQLGNYRLVRLLGEGGFANVYLGEHFYLKTFAAIKLLQMRVVKDDQEDFLAEARTIANLAHPNIVRILDFGVENGSPFLVMEYAPNGTLRERHRKGMRLSPAVILPYVKQIADSLQYAHERKLVHRDVKPENMLLGSKNEILLSDFGIALVTQSSRYQSTHEVIGTASYMAPEQFLGKPRPASDQYALGIVVYEWLCGERPFYGSFTELYSQHMFVSPPSLCEKVPGISPDVEQVVLTALAKDPLRRFVSMQAFANALEQACEPTLIQPILQDTRPGQSPLPTVINTTCEQSQNEFIAISPEDQHDKPVIISPIDRSLPKVIDWKPGQPNTRSKLLVTALIAAALFIFFSSGIFYFYTINSNRHSSVVKGNTTTVGAASPIIPSVSTTGISTRGTKTLVSGSTTTAATAIPEPTTAMATAKPTMTTIAATATPIATTTAVTATPSPTPVPGSTIHLTQCGNYLVAPWVALYQYSHFGGQQICFSGVGFINLSDYGFDKQTMAINIAANGVFFDQANATGNKLGFYYSDEQGDLGNWDNQISSFRVDN